MSTATVRAACQAWFAGTPGFGHVWKGQPAKILPADFSNPAGGLWPVAFIHMDHRSEQRISGPSKGGVKQVTHTVAVVIVTRWMIQPGDVGDEWSGYVDGNIDAVVNRIRADYMLGTGGSPVWQAGEEVGDIESMQDLPVTEGGVGEQRSVVQFTAIEMVTGV